MPGIEPKYAAAHQIDGRESPRPEYKQHEGQEIINLEAQFKPCHHTLCSCVLQKAEALHRAISPSHKIMEHMCDKVNGRRETRSQGILSEMSVLYSRSRLKVWLWQHIDTAILSSAIAFLISVDSDSHCSRQTCSSLMGNVP